MIPGRWTIVGTTQRCDSRPISPPPLLLGGRRKSILRTIAASVLEERNVFAAAEERFAGIIDELQSPARQHMGMSDLEKLLQAEGSQLLRELLQGHMDLRSLGRVEETVTGADGVGRRDRHRRSRTVNTVFGTVELNRERFHETGSPGLAPLDAELNLPPERASLELRRRVARLAAKMSFDDVVDEIRETTGTKLAKRQVEELARASARDFEAFYEARRVAALESESPSETDGEPNDSILVITTDGKGIPMLPESLREATRKTAEKSQPKLQKRRSKGEKGNRKRMATVAAVYSIAPHPRLPEDVMAGLRPAPERPAVKRPVPQDKRVWASVSAPAEGVVCEMFEEAMARHRDRPRRWVALVDGNEVQLGNILTLAEHHGVELTLIIDVIHVLEYLWKAGTAFKREGTPELEKWVQTRFQQILQGQAKRVATGLRRAATRRKLGAKQRKPVDTCANYLDKNAAYVAYDEYLAQGLPIATGVIEGACRYLVKDRMEKTGARWHLDGAEAILRLRSLFASRDFDAYWSFHEKAEHHRNHLAQYADESPPRVEPPRPPGRPNLRLVE